MHVPTRDEDCLPCGDSKNTSKSMSAQERKIQDPASNPHEVLGPRASGEESQEGPGNSKGHMPFPGHKTGSRGPHRHSRGTCRNLRKSRRFIPTGEMRTFSAEASRG